MPVVIIGMHRSGTSLTTSILQKNGLFIGERGELFGPSASNKDGFFEFKKIVALNQHMLRSLKANWNKPPEIPIDFDVLHDKFGEEARNILVYFTSQAQGWGFKDPRTTILYPFWKRLLSDHKVVFCVRHPSEVQASLIKRNGMGTWRQLWLQYMRRGIRYTKDSQVHFLFHEDYFIDPDTSVGKLLEFCELPLKTIGVVKSELRHHNANKSMTKMDDAIELYERLYLIHHRQPKSS